jgi:hypothetical protein
VQRNKANYPGSGVKVKRFLCVAQSKQLPASKGFLGGIARCIAAKQEEFPHVWSNICG